jgi:hypothetical protein
VSGVTAECYRYADMIPAGDAIERIRSSMWQTAPVVAKVAAVRKEAFKRPRIVGGIGWGLHKAKSNKILYDTVAASRLALYAWPTRTAINGTRQPEEALDVLRPVPVKLIKQLRPLHGGLPSSFVGGRQPILKHFAGIATTDVPVFLGSEFERWLENERRKGGWATQRPLDAEDNRARSPRKPGRPSIQKEVEQTIEAIVADDEWTNSEPASQLGRLVRNRGIKANDDTVRQVLDNIYIRTGDRRFQRRLLHKRNPAFRNR